MGAQPGRSHRLLPFAPVAAVASVLLAEGHFYGHYALSSEALALPSLSWQIGPRSLDWATRDFLSRYSLHLSGTMLLLFWLAVVGVAIDVIRRANVGKPLWLRAAVLGLPVVYSAWAIIAATFEGRNHVLIRLPRELIEQFSGNLQDPVIVTYEALLSACVVSALAFLTIAAYALLTVDPLRDSGPLHERYRQLQILLYGGAATLVVGILHINVALHWPMSFLGDTEAKVLRSLADGYSTITGFYWSLLLIAFYLPAALVLRGTAWELAGQMLDHPSFEERETWLAQQKLTPSLFEQTARLGALLGPLLAGGPLASLIHQIRD